MPELTAAQWRYVMAQRVGGFFRNTFRETGRTCLYCTGPSFTPLCSRCAEDRAAFGAERLADAVVTLTYAQDRHPKGRHQSVYTAYAYKYVPPAETCEQDMRLLVRAATVIHGRCIAAVGWWDSVTFVPSTKRELAPHLQAAAGLAKMVRWNNAADHRLVLERGPSAQGLARTIFPDRFVVPERYTDRVQGKHVLVVDDTWTSGAKMQSAAMALKDAGARRVTALCVTRWTRWDWSDHEAVLRTLDTPYDPLRCPVHGGICEP